MSSRALSGVGCPCSTRPPEEPPDEEPSEDPLELDELASGECLARSHRQKHSSFPSTPIGSSNCIVCGVISRLRGQYTELALNRVTPETDAIATLDGPSKRHLVYYDAAGPLSFLNNIQQPIVLVIQRSQR